MINEIVTTCKSEKAKLILQKTFAFCIVSLFILSSASAQKRDSSAVQMVFNHGLQDTKDYLLSPTQWNKTDWIVAGGLSVTTGALILWGDQTIYNFTNTLKSPKRDAFFENTEPLGNIYPAMAISAIMLKGFIQKDNYALETSLIALESYVFSGVFNRTGKMLAGRRRPNNDKTTNSHQWDGPFFKNASFFSGHTTTAFSIASVFAYRYQDTHWVPVVAYGLASIAGIQRIYGNRHWASDVLVGAAVGTATGVFLSKQWEKNSIQFYPSVGANQTSLSLIIPIH